MATIGTSRTRVSDRARLHGLWRNPDFLKLWAAEAVSLFGTQITMLALPLTAVVLLDATPSQMGMLGAAQTVPFLLLSLFAGVWVDHRRRRPILIAANLARAVLLGLIPLLALLNVLRIEHLYAIAFLVGACAVFFDLAYIAYLPRLVERDRLVEGNSKLQGTASVAEIGGPGVAGVLVGVLTAPFAVALDAVSFVVAALSLSRIRKPEPGPVLPEDGGNLRQEIGEGIRATFHNRYLLAFAGEAATYNICWNAINAILLLYAVRVLGISSGTLGLLLSVGSTGALLGAFMTQRWARRFGIGATMIGSAVVSNIGTFMIPLAAGSDRVLLLILGVGFFLRGLGMTGCNVQVYAVRQAIVPDRLQGRVNATYRLLTYGFIPLGALLGGFLGDHIGLRPTLLLSASVLFFSWVWLFFSPVRALRKLP